MLLITFVIFFTTLIQDYLIISQKERAYRINQDGF